MRSSPGLQAGVFCFGRLPCGAAVAGASSDLDHYNFGCIVRMDYLCLMMIIRNILMAGCLALALAANEGAKTVAVMDLDVAEGISAGEAQSIANRLETELSRLDTFVVLERRRMDDILEEQGFQQSGACDNTQCRVQIGQLLGVDRLVVGSLGKVGNVYSLNAKLLDVQTGAILRSHAIDTRGDLSQVLTQACVPMAQMLATGKSERAEIGTSHTWWWIAGGATLLAALSAGTYLLLQDDSETTVKTVDRTLEAP